MYSELNKNCRKYYQMLICIHQQSTAFIVATSTKLTHAQRNYVGYTINWRKSNQQMHCNCVPSVKIYLFIYRTDMFRLFPSRHAMHTPLHRTMVNNKIL